LAGTAIVVLFGVAGLVVGVKVTSLGGPRYEAFEQLTLPAHSHEAPWPLACGFV